MTKRGARKTYYADSQRECNWVVVSTIRHGACCVVAPFIAAGLLFSSSFFLSSPPTAL